MIKHACLVLVVLFASSVSGAEQTAKPSETVDCTLLGSPKHVCSLVNFGTALRTVKTVAVVAVDTSPSWASVAKRFNGSVSDNEYEALRMQYFQKFIQPRISASESITATLQEFKKITARDKIPRVGVVDRIVRQEDNNQNKKLEKRVESLLRSWGHFSIVADPEQADLVLEVRRYSWFGFDTGEEQPVSFILAWGKGANPKTDDITWLEKDEGRWKTSDTVGGVIRGFRNSVEAAERTRTR
jgi:hypothetical protein